LDLKNILLAVKSNHIYMLEGGSDDSDNLGGNFSDNLSDNLSNNPDDVEIDLTETNFNSVPDYVAMEIPLVFQFR
jgi:hypothetical protein